MSLETLTATQRAVYDQLILGKTNLAIAKAVHMAEKTVKAHVTAIFKQLKCKSRAEVIVRHYRGDA